MSLPGNHGDGGRYEYLPNTPRDLEDMRTIPRHVGAVCVCGQTCSKQNQHMSQTFTPGVRTLGVVRNQLHDYSLNSDERFTAYWHVHFTQDDNNSDLLLMTRRSRICDYVLNRQNRADLTQLRPEC